MTNVLAIIPARGGSKAIPRKNAVDFCGKPLLAWSIEHARSSRRINRVVVSTDDHEIAGIAKRYNAEVIARPAELSTDQASSESALRHVIESLQQAEGYIPDIVVFLQATSPLRGPTDLDDAMAMLEREGADSLVSVAPTHGFLWEMSANGCRPVTYDPERRPRRQDMHNEYALENGSFFIFKLPVLLKYNSRLGGKITVFRQALVDSFEINDPEDLEFLRALYLAKVRGSGSAGL